MSGVVFRIMLLTFVRDRHALTMSIVLPIAFFLVFATIFAGSSGEHLRVRIAFCDEVRSDASTRLLRALARDPALEPVAPGPLPAARVRELVRSGGIDAGLIVRREAEPLGSMGGFGAPPLLLLSDPTRAVAAQLVAGLVQKAYFTWLPDVALGGVVELLQAEFVELTPEQGDAAQAALSELRGSVLADEARARPPSVGLEELVERRAIERPARARNHVAYYAGAVAILFLLFSAVHGSLSMFEERDSGILDRLLAGPAGAAALVNGKFLFLLAQGFFQVSVIFLVAWLAYGVELPARLPGYGLVTVAASAAAAGLALALTTACATARQAQTLANAVILITSAVGGSMVPRFFMPPLIQDLGWLTPTTWALEAYTRLFWRGEPLGSLLLPVAMLLLAGGGGLTLAHAAARRWQSV